ncbi:hypothetical protein BHM03_00017903, partial [Ensete ventricosum]
VSDDYSSSRCGIDRTACGDRRLDSFFLSRSRHRGGRALLEVSSRPLLQRDAKQPIRILLNYDAVGHSPDRDCQNVGDLVKIVGTTAHRRTFQGRIKNDVFESLTQSVGHVNVAPRHLTAEAETLLSATLIHEVSKVLQISPSITPVPEFEIMVLLSTVLMLFCQAFSEKFTGLELEDGGGRGTSGTFNFISVAVDGVWKVCPESGGPVQFSGFNGELICPAYHELCSGAPVPINGQCPGSCSFNGDCIDGECHCYLGFHGNDCSQSELT